MYVCACLILLYTSAQLFSTRVIFIIALLLFLIHNLFFYASCGGRYKGRTIGGDEFIRRVSASAVIYPSVYASDAPVSHSFHSSSPRVVSSLVSLLPLVSLNHPSLGASISLNGEHSSSGAPTAPHVIRFLLRRVDGLTVMYCSGGKV